MSDETRQRNYVSASVDVDHQHGLIVTTIVGDIQVSVYLHAESGVVTAPTGQFGLEVSGPWNRVRALLAAGVSDERRD